MSISLNISSFLISLIFLFFNFDLLASSKTENNYDAVKEYLNNLNTLEASFIQISSDGQIKRGKIFFKETTYSKLSGVLDSL